MKTFSSAAWPRNGLKREGEALTLTRHQTVEVNAEMLYLVVDN